MMASVKIGSSPSIKSSHNQQQQQQQQQATLKLEGGSPAMANGNPNAPAAPAADTKPVTTQHQLLHNPGIAVEWTAEEQSILDESLVKFGNETGLWKYIKIAALLAEKTVRDVALRCRWMAKKELGKRRKAEEQQNIAKKPKDKKEKTLEPPAKPAGPASIKPNMPMYTTTPPLPIDSDDGISNEAIGGTAGELFQQNLQVTGQIRANLAACKAQENTDLLVRFRDNLYAILNGMTSVPGIMSHMPPLPVAVNTDLADSILPKSLHQPSPLQQS